MIDLPIRDCILLNTSNTIWVLMIMLKTEEFEISGKNQHYFV